MKDCKKYTKGIRIELILKKNQYYCWLAENTRNEVLRDTEEFYVADFIMRNLFHKLKTILSP
jgi:hypothetical protein